MHAIHAVLVNLKDTSIDVDEKEIVLTKLGGKQPGFLEDIRSYAEEETEQYANQAYDWRETETAGRWSDLYHCNVVAGKLEKEQFLNVFDEFSQIPEKEIRHFLAQAKQKNNGESIALTYETLTTLGMMPLYYLCKSLKILNGYYVFDSHFWSISHDKSLLSEEEKNEIRQNIDNYALVMFDYHN